MNADQEGIMALKTEIKELLISVSGMSQYRPEDITDDMSLFQDGLGLDSIDVLEFVVRLDKTYGLKILNDDDGRKVLRNVSTIAEAIHGRQGASS